MSIADQGVGVDHERVDRENEDEKVTLDISLEVNLLRMALVMPRVKIIAIRSLNRVSSELCCTFCGS